MNSANLTRDAVVTWEWDYVEGQTTDYAHLKPLWLDVGGVCSGAEVPVPQGADTFTFKQDPPWTSTICGDIITMGGHIHDGGTGVRILKNGQVICDSTTTYETSLLSLEPSGNHSHHGMGGMSVSHISSMKICNWSGMGSTSIGDEWTVEATYNISQHTPMMRDGKPDPVMGNAMVYIAESPSCGSL